MGRSTQIWYSLGTDNKLKMGEKNGDLATDGFSAVLGPGGLFIRRWLCTNRQIQMTSKRTWAAEEHWCYSKGEMCPFNPLTNYWFQNTKIREFQSSTGFLFTCFLSMAAMWSSMKGPSSVCMLESEILVWNLLLSLIILDQVLNI